MTMPSASARPELALVIAGKGAFDAAPFWAALAGQEPPPLAMLVHDGRTPIPVPAGVQAVALPGASLFRLWGEGIARARAAGAEYVAIMDANSPPEPGWLAAISAAIGQGGDAYHGPVTARYRAGDRRVVGYLVEYVQFDPPVQEWMGEVAGSNIVFRTALAPPDAVLRDEGFLKTALLASGVRPEKVPDAVVCHQKPFDFRAYVRRRFRHGRCYAADRIRGRGWPARVAHAGVTPLLPLVRVWRIWRHVARRPRFRPAFWQYLALILVAETGWSLGETCGYLAGEGGCRALLD